MADELPTEYTAAVLKKHGTDLEMEKMRLRECAYGECLIKLTVSGLCHTDLHVQDGDWEVTGKLPVVLGHEGVGLVVAVGPGTKQISLGDRVCVPWLREACASCEHCLQGWESVCPTVTNSGYTADGSFAEYVYAPAAWIGKVPRGLPDEQAAPITCAGVTVYKALKESRVRTGQWIAIVGASGGLGHIAVQYAQAMGLKVLGIDAGQEKINYLKELGCDATIDAIKTTDLISQAIQETHGGPNGSIILVPIKTAVGDAVRYCKPRSVIVPIALPPGDLTASTLVLIVKGIRIQGSIVGTRQDLTEALEIAAEGKVKAKVELRPFSKVNDSIRDLRGGKVIGRLVLDLRR